MRIRRISVDGLFGIFNHDIPMRLDERMTIIHGLNGYGKTTILKLVNALFHRRYSDLRTTPFKEFRVELEDGSCLVVNRLGRTSEVSPSMFAGNRRWRRRVPPVQPREDRSRIAFSRFKSLRLARRIARAITGANSLENPAGAPRFRKTILVAPCSVSVQAYVVSIGKGPSEVLITNRSPGTSSLTS